MIRHHPEDTLLLAHAAGQLPAGPAIVVASHIESCPHCCERMHELEAVGGALLETAEPVLLEPQALARALAAIDGGDLVHPMTSARPGQPAVSPAAAWPELPAGARWPQALRGCTIAPWRWVGPGMHWSRVTMPHDPEGNLFLLRIRAGRKLPTHSHSELEMTQVIHGAFHDGRHRFEAGDFDGADDSVHHQPVVAADGECICLATVQGRLLPAGFIARTIGRLVGI